MIENKIKMKSNLQININNLISKPSYLMTTNPDKFLQKSNYKPAMTIKDRDELNPEMAEIVRKIMIKRKNEKKSSNKYDKNNNSMIKSRKVDSLKKYFDDNYNRKHGINKENYYKLNNSLIYDYLNDRLDSEHNDISYFDYMNKTSNNKKKNLKKTKLNASCNYSCSRNTQNLSNNLVNLKENKNNIDDFKSLNKQTKNDKKLSNSLNFEESEYEDYTPKNVQKIKIIKNNQYIVNLNSITIDVDQINNDKNLMEINCNTLENNFINPKLLLPIENNKSSHKNIRIKRKEKISFDETNEINEKKEKKPIKNESTKNVYSSKIKNLENNNDMNNFKNKLSKLNNKQIKLNKINENKIILNKSTEHRNKFNINKNENERFNMTMSNGFYSGNNANNYKINNNNNNNKKEIKNQKIKLDLNKPNKKDIKKDILSVSNKKEKQKINKEIITKKLNKNQFKNNNTNFSNYTNKKINTTKTHRIKFNPSPSHSKNGSNLSTERSLNNKINTKIMINKNKNKNKYGQNRSLSKDYFQTEPNQKLNVNKNDKSQNHCETLSMNISNKNNLIMNDLNRIKNNKKEEKENQKDIINTERIKSDNINNINLQEKINNGGKKEYPNMAKFFFEKKQSIDELDEDQIKTSKNRETKAIKKIESICKKGYSGPGIKKTNQDNFFIYNNFNNNSNYIYLGVCDGHGIFGQDISTYLVNNLPQKMNRNVIDKGIKNLSNENIATLSSLFQETFIQTNASLNEDERIDSSFSGSTCVSLLFTPTRICCINVGDSRAIIGKFNGCEWSSKPLSRDHKPSEPDEMNRIIKSGGKVESYRDNFGNFVGPERVWTKSMDGPGLAMSRSFGDEIAHKIGVVVDPEILEYYFLKEDKFIVLGSDGIWEFISNNEVVDIVKNYYLDNNIEGAIEYLYNESSKRWIMEEEVIDDITIIVIFLN